MKKKIKKNLWQIVLLLVVFLMVLVLSLKNKTTRIPSNNSFSPTPVQEFPLPDYSQPPLTSEGKVDYQSEEVQKAVQSKTKLSSLLPIYVEEFQTSIDITTTINIFSISQDPDYLVHIDIYGINYQDQETDESKNPSAAAFKESFIKARGLLEENGVDIEDIYFVFGGRQYIQETAELWIKTFNLMDTGR